MPERPASPNRPLLAPAFIGLQRGLTEPAQIPLAREVGLTRFGGHPEAFARGAADAKNPPTPICRNFADRWSTSSVLAVILTILPAGLSRYRDEGIERLLAILGDAPVAPLARPLRQTVVRGVWDERRIPRLYPVSQSWLPFRRRRVNRVGDTRTHSGRRPK